jgi:hypothetical protein
MRHVDDFAQIEADAGGEGDAEGTGSEEFAEVLALNVLLEEIVERPEVADAGDALVEVADLALECGSSELGCRDLLSTRVGTELDEFQSYRGVVVFAVDGEVHGPHPALGQELFNTKLTELSGVHSRVWRASVLQQGSEV